MKSKITNKRKKSSNGNNDEPKMKKNIKKKKKTKQDAIAASAASASSKESILSLCNIVGTKLNSNVINNNNVVEEDPFAFQTEGVPTSEHQQYDSTNVEDLDSCLALMDQSFNEVSNDNEMTSKATTIDEKEENGKTKEDDTPTTKSNNNNDSLWKTHNKIYAQGNGTMEDFYLPNIQIELARHKHMGELSQFLLSKCPTLRMPSFERWLIDSKMEERLKREAIQETNQQINMAAEVNANSTNRYHQHKEMKWKERMKRKRNDLKSSLDRHMTTSGMRTLNDYDCVIPTMSDLDDDATQRLLKEIQSSTVDDDDDSDNNNDDKKSRTKSRANMIPQNICRELCQKACTATRHLQNLNHHLGGDIHMNQYFNNNNHSKKKKSSASNSIGKIVLKTMDTPTNDANAVNDNDGANEKRQLVETYSLVYSRKSKKGGTTSGSGEGEGAGAGEKMKPFVVKINTTHYEKLREMFNSIHHINDKLHVPAPSTLRRDTNYTPATKIFHHLVFCILVRYASLSGGQQLLDLRGGGMQGAIHNQVFDCLSKFCQTDDSIIECFASPLNAYNRQYCSIFHQDLDYHFGSSGDFFTVPLGHFKKQGGDIHEANPPFAPSLMKCMVERLIEHLAFADLEASQKKNDGKLTFVIVVPTCAGHKRTAKTNESDNLVHTFASESFSAMIKSPFFVKHLVLKAREHGYVEGSQHLRQTRYKESQYSTSVVILQSRSSRENEVNNPIFTSEEFDTGLRKSFTSKHKSELDERRMKLDDGGKNNTKASKQQKRKKSQTKGKRISK